MKADLKVELLTYTPNPLRTVASAAKLCYSKVGIDAINEKMNDADAEKFVNMLRKMGHMSPFEHISFSFAIEGVSRTLTHQLVRHRLASYSQQSQRYVDEDQFDYIVPPSILKNEEALKVFNKTMNDIQMSYDKLKDQLIADWEKKLIKEGKDEKKANKDAIKMANEDARFVLPGACETKIIATMNARELLHFFGERTCNRAQWEIRELAIQMLFLAKKACPAVFKGAGPSCVTSNCREGIMSCGKAEEVKKRIYNL